MNFCSSLIYTSRQSCNPLIIAQTAFSVSVRVRNQNESDLSSGFANSLSLSL